MVRQQGSIILRSWIGRIQVQLRHDVGNSAGLRRHRNFQRCEGLLARLDLLVEAVGFDLKNFEMTRQCFKEGLKSFTKVVTGWIATLSALAEGAIQNSHQLQSAAGKHLRERYV